MARSPFGFVHHVSAAHQYQIDRPVMCVIFLQPTICCDEP